MAAAPLGEIPVKETASNVSWLPWTDIAFFFYLFLLITWSWLYFMNLSFSYKHRPDC